MKMRAFENVAKVIWKKIFSYFRPSLHTWTIFANETLPDHVIRLRILESDLQSGYNCYSDIVEIIDGNYY